jgi:hypothetical protein
MVEQLCMLQISSVIPSKAFPQHGRQKTSTASVGPSEVHRRVVFSSPVPRHFEFEVLR